MFSKVQVTVYKQQILVDVSAKVISATEIYVDINGIILISLYLFLSLFVLYVMFWWGLFCLLFFLVCKISHV